MGDAVYKKPPKSRNEYVPATISILKKNNPQYSAATNPPPQKKEREAKKKKSLLLFQERLKTSLVAAINHLKLPHFFPSK